ncbi:hypothetical protein OIY81_970 [Cryptosporidium canis]|uniref:U6 snRNA-associated Sm-like protein LSm4 n=1 Tax=Cryptosporidium canis TaxID=195482 RepID=A0ABQ8P5F9_9CRYT|nr:hypothetical protein OJ252_2362 [Cryptosporidium canis]KAJ1613410.1 hypothetical protein OIY81_970 [Cryptosporidium canis]
MVELKNGETYSGILTGVDGFMNLVLNNVICGSRGGNDFFKVLECYIRGNNIKFIRISDDNVSAAKDEMVQREISRPGNRGRPRNESRSSRTRPSKWA